jgi:hypothetical protein
MPNLSDQAKPGRGSSEEEEEGGEAQEKKCKHFGPLRINARNHMCLNKDPDVGRGRGNRQQDCYVRELLLNKKL